MTEAVEGPNEGNVNPVILIQSDWDDVIFSTSQEIWISCKYIGKNSIHSKLRNHGNNSIKCTTNDFSVVSFAKNAISIRYNPSGHVYTFVPPLKTFSKIHNKKVLSLGVADGGLGVSACVEDKLVIWSSVTGDVLRTLSGHVCNVYKCKFFPSGIVVLSGGADMQLKIWSAETGDCPVTLIGHKAAISDFCIVDRGRNIISVSRDGSAILWDCGKSEILATIFHCCDVLNCCFITTLPEYMQHTREEPINDREIGTTNKLLLIGTETGYIYGIAIYYRKIAFTIKASSAVNMVLAVGRKIAFGCQDGKIEVYDLSNVEKPEKVFFESASPVICGCPYKDGFFVGRNDGTVTYYNCINYSDCRISLTGSDCDQITDIACSSYKVFTSCRDGKIRQYGVNDLIKNTNQS